MPYNTNNTSTGYAVPFYYIVAMLLLLLLFWQAPYDALLVADKRPKLIQLYHDCHGGMKYFDFRSYDGSQMVKNA